MDHILWDSRIFRKIHNGDVYKLSLQNEDEVNRLLRKLKDRGAISADTYQNLSSSETGPGILYGLPKVHKKGVPLRPILVAYNVASYKLAKFLIPLLENLTSNQHTLKNSYDFYNKIHAAHIP